MVVQEKKQIAGGLEIHLDKSMGSQTLVNTKVSAGVEMAIN